MRISLAMHLPKISTYIEDNLLVIGWAWVGSGSSIDSDSDLLGLKILDSDPKP